MTNEDVQDELANTLLDVYDGNFDNEEIVSKELKQFSMHEFDGTEKSEIEVPVLTITFVGDTENGIEQGYFYVFMIEKYFYNFSLLQPKEPSVNYLSNLEEIIKTLSFDKELVEGTYEEEKTSENAVFDEQEISDSEDYADDEYYEEDTEDGTGMYISGCNTYIITTNMKDTYNIEEPSPIENKDGYLFSSENLGYSYQIYTYRNLKDVYMADFAISNLYGDNKEDFLELAKGYLGFAASIPYDTADSEAAKEWLEDNIYNSRTGKTIEATFGEAKFELYGDYETGTISLDIAISPFPY